VRGRSATRSSPRSTRPDSGRGARDDYTEYEQRETAWAQRSACMIPSLRETRLKESDRLSRRLAPSAPGLIQSVDAR
jgi:hypothetical protein